MSHSLKPYTKSNLVSLPLPPKQTIHTVGLSNLVSYYQIPYSPMFRGSMESALISP